MRLAESVQSLLVLDDTDAGDRDQAFAAILNQMSLDSLVPATLVSELMTALIRRDELGPTGIGEGVAIPHVWHAGIDRVLAALAVSRRGLDYPSLDGEPVHLILLILTPSGAGVEPAKRSLFDTWLHHLRDPAFRAELRLVSSVEELRKVLQTAGSVST